MSKPSPFVCWSRKRHFTAASVPPDSADQAVSLALQQDRRGLQSELNVLADSVVQVDRGKVGRRFARPMFERERQVDLPFFVARRPRIVRDHRRPALPQCLTHGKSTNSRGDKKRLLQLVTRHLPATPEALRRRVTSLPARRPAASAYSAQRLAVPAIRPATARAPAEIAPSANKSDALLDRS